MKRSNKAIGLAGACALMAAGSAWGCFFHSPLLSVKDPYEVVGDCRARYDVEIAPEKYVVVAEGEDDAQARKRGRLARLESARSELLKKADEALRKPGQPDGKRPAGNVGWGMSGMYLRTEGVGPGEKPEKRASYENARAWIEAFPFPEKDDPAALDRIPDARIDDLEKAIQAFPEIVRARLYAESLAGFLMLAENLVFLDAGNISVAEFPNFKEWRGDIPRVLKRMREVMGDGGGASAEAAARTLVFLWTSCPEVEKQHRIRARPDLQEDLKWILKRIGPRDALPPLVAALPLVDAETRQRLLRMIKEIGKKGAPSRKGTPEEAIAWYEERWGPWPDRRIPVLDLSPVELAPKPEEAQPR